jgi:L-fucose isomerase-like protein
MTVKDRRDSFCGKMSACNNLAQYGIPYSLTGLHTVDPSSKAFRKDLKNFAACCRVVRGLRGARIGALGARPSAFNTVRFSEKVLEANGISVDVIDLFDAFGRIGKLNDSDKRVKSKYEDLIKYVTIGEVPEEALLKMAKLGVFMDEWAAENEFDATAVQCWTAMQDYFGIVPCTVMSRLSDSLLPSACEVDITGAIGMLALTCASGKPSALLDWNNNYGDDPDRCVVWHCSNLPRSVFKEAHMSYHEIIAKTIDKDKTFGTCYGQIKAGPFTFARVSTDDLKGRIRAFVGEGEIIDQKLETFGGFGVAHIPKLQSLLRYICKNGFEHHVALNQSEVSRGLHDALSTYLCWEVYLHGQDE